MSVGVNVTDNVCVPAFRIVPAIGEYENVPGTGVLAFSCVEVSGVPYVMPEGAGHVIAGIALSTTIVTVVVTALKAAESAGVNVTDKVCEPAPRTVPAAGE